MTTLYLYDDARARKFEPFASTRPVSELVAGTTLLRTRWTRALGVEGAQFLAGPRHVDFDEPGAAAAQGTLPAGSIVANARFAPALAVDLVTSARRSAGCSMWRAGTELAAVRLKEPADASVFADGTLALDTLHAGTGAIGTIDGWWLDEVWDFVRLLQEQIAQDILRLREALGDAGTVAVPPYATAIGTHPIVLARRAGPSGTDAAATIEPHVVLDATAGPIFIGAGTHVRAFTRIVGPCYIGADVQVMGGDISGCSIGEVCKVRGELSSTIFLGHANKGHDGFVGHSYLGRWVNLGAGTITSNLKNTYGSVALWTPDGVRDTGMQFLGTLFGDHVKTGIGLRLTTGTVLGAGANVYGTMPPKAVSPFSWGEAPNYTTYRADKFMETAARVMARRHVELSERMRRHLTAVHAARWTADAGDSRS